MHVVITIELTIIVSSIFAIRPKLILMFFHIDSIRKFRSFIHSWRSATIAIIVIIVRGVGDSKGEKQLLTANGEGEFNGNVIVFRNNFKTKYEQLFEAYNASHCGMVIIKNVTTTTKGDRYLKAQHYTILTKVMNEATRTCIMQLHNKLSSVQSTFKKVNSYPFLCIIFYSIYT